MHSFRYPNLDLEFTVEKSILLDRGQLKTDYPDIVDNLIAEKGIRCTVASSFFRVNAQISSITPKIVIYLNCMHAICKSYKFCVMDSAEENLRIKLFSRGEFSEDAHSSFSVTRPVSRTKRVEVATQLKHMSPSTYRAKTVIEATTNSISANRLEFGGMGPIKSIDVFKKIKHQEREKNDHHKDDFIDIYMKQQDPRYKEWLHTVTSPFKIVVFSQNQIDLLLKMKPESLFFDATGNICRSRIFFNF